MERNHLKSVILNQAGRIGDKSAENIAMESLTTNSVMTNIKIISVILIRMVLKIQLFCLKN